jgi:hypothetical protein
MAAKTFTAEEIEFARQLHVQNVNRYNALTTHPRNSEIANELGILSKRMEMDTKLVGQRYGPKLAAIVKQFQATSLRIGALEGKVGVQTPPPPKVAPIVTRDEPATRTPKEAVPWYKNPWYWAAGGAAVLVTVALLSRGKDSKE